MPANERKLHEDVAKLADAILVNDKVVVYES